MSLTIKSGMPLDISIPGYMLNTGDDEAFYRFAMSYPYLAIERDPDGNIVMEPPVNFQTGGFESEVQIELGVWNRKYGLGKVFSPMTGFVLPNGAMRCPDGAWISNERVAALPKAEWNRFARICPDFVMEIRSASDRLKPLQKKMEEYIDNGARLGFLIDPLEQQAFIYRPGIEVEHVSGFEGVLYGDPELPGFELPLGLFRNEA